jgi:TetR/AcrR family transcriptional regulator
MSRPPLSVGRDTRQAIRAAAIRLFAQKGFAGATTREICEAAGVTKPVLYHYYSTKEDLFRRILEETVEEYGRGLRQAAAMDAPPRRRLEEVVCNGFRFARNDRELFSVLHRVVFAPEPAMPPEIVIRIPLEEIEALMSIAEEGIRARALSGQPFEIAISILGVSNIQKLRYLVAGEDILTPELARRCVEIALRGCCATPQGQPIQRPATLQFDPARSPLGALSSLPGAAKRPTPATRKRKAQPRLAAGAASGKTRRTHPRIAGKPQSRNTKR